jgi:hypothetical protein
LLTIMAIAPSRMMKDAAFPAGATVAVALVAVRAGIMATKGNHNGCPGKSNAHC